MEPAPPSNSFSIDGEDPVATPVETPDTLVIEDLPEDGEEQVHDQLPSVEEAKANLAPASSKKKYILAAAFVIVLAGIITAIVLATKGNKKEQAFEPTGRAADVMQFLFDNKVSALPSLQDQSTPQHKAAVFVADGDVYQMEFSEASKYKFVERYVLTVLYYHFNGAEWTHQLNFLSARDHCEWSQDFKSNKGNIIKQGVVCSEDGHVIGLNLAWNNLNANYIAPEIKYLGQLQSLKMYYNNIGGNFPDVFREMPYLKAIELMKVGMGGTIPEWIGEMGQLTSLLLGDNAFRGEVPKSISNLKALKLLGLDDNSLLSGNLELFKSMAGLEALYLENNAFTGELAGASWGRLKELDVSHNMIDGIFDASLINHDSMIVVDVNNNMIVGKLPDDILENDNLRFLAVQHNYLDGTISDRIAFLRNLEHVDISANAFTGTIPDTVQQLTDLRYWASSGNRFDEQNILDFSKMSKLMDISFKGNNLVGTIPDWFGELTDLQLLDLDSNNLKGKIPTWLGLMRELDHLLLNRNQLTGTIPSQLATLPHLKVLLLDGNSISGNAEAICDGNLEPQIFVADCYPGQNGQAPEVQCRCCTSCCADSDTSCNNFAWTSNIDPTYEYGYYRPSYSFNLENAPMIYSKDGL